MYTVMNQKQIILNIKKLFGNICSMVSYKIILLTEFK